MALPVACIAFAVLLLWPKRGRPAVSDPDDEGGASRVDAEERATIRIAIGAALLFVADVGILHLAYGRPALDGPTDALRDVGGDRGGLVAAPLTAGTGVVGAVVILLGVAVLGALLALGLSLRTAAEGSARGAGTAVAWLRSVLAPSVLEPGDAAPPADPDAWAAAVPTFDVDAVPVPPVVEPPVDTAQRHGAELATHLQRPEDAELHRSPARTLLAAVHRLTSAPLRGPRHNRASSANRLAAS